MWVLQKIGLPGLALMICSWPLLGHGQTERNEQGNHSERRKQASSAHGKDNTEGGVDESPRQRTKVLDKRNPLASEYQGVETIGYIALADQDSEGNNSRSRIHTGDLFNIEGRRIEGEVSYRYNEQSDKGAEQGSLAYQQILGKKENWAILFQKKRSEAHPVYESGISRWSPLQFGSETSYLLSRFTLRYYSISTAITQYSFVIQHRRDEGHRLYFKAQLEEREDFNRSRNLQHLIGSGEIINFGLTGASVRNATATRTIFDSHEQRDRIRFLVGGKLENIHSQFDYSYYFSEWNRTKTGGISSIFKRNGIDYTYSLENSVFPALSIDNAADLDDVSLFRFIEVSSRESTTEDRDHVVEVNHKRWGTIGNSTLYLKLGGAFRSKSRLNMDTRSIWESYDGSFNVANIARGQVGRIVQNLYSFGPDVDPDLFRDFFARNRHGFKLAENRTKIETPPNNYSVKEEVGGFYILQEFDRQRLIIKGGLRLEFARTQTNGKEVITDESGYYLHTNLIEHKNEYTHLFPSLEVDYRWHENLGLGVAWFHALARPDYFDLVPYRRVLKLYQYISEGNPALVPTELNNLVAVLDMKSEFTGKLTASLYYRGIDRFFYASELLISDGELDGWRIRRKENGESGSIWGFEFSWDRELHLLPEKWGELTVSGFYTFSESKAKVKTRPGEQLLIPERSRHLASFILGHTLGSLKSVLALKYQSQYLDEIGIGPSEDEYIDDALHLDAMFDYQWLPMASLFVKFYNLGDTPKRKYNGIPTRLSQAEYDSWKVLLGCRFTL